MFSGQRPDITPAQIVAALAWVLSQAVAFGLLDSKHSQDILSLGTTAVATGWIVADALLRGLRNLHHGTPPPPP